MPEQWIILSLQFFFFFPLHLHCLHRNLFISFSASLFIQQEQTWPTQLTGSSWGTVILTEFKNSVNTYKIDMSPRTFPLLVNCWVTAAQLWKEAESCKNICMIYANIHILKNNWVSTYGTFMEKSGIPKAYIKENRFRRTGNAEYRERLISQLIVTTFQPRRCWVFLCYSAKTNVNDIEPKNFQNTKWKAVASLTVLLNKKGCIIFLQIYSVPFIFSVSF